MLDLIEIEMLVNFTVLFLDLTKLWCFWRNYIVVQSLLNNVDQPVGRAVTRSSLKQEVWGWNSDPIKHSVVTFSSQELLCQHSQELGYYYRPGYVVTRFGVTQRVYLNLNRLEESDKIFLLITALGLAGSPICLYANFSGRFCIAAEYLVSK